MRFSALYLGLYAAGVLGAPATTRDTTPTVTKYVDSEATVYQWDEGWNKDFIIHSSCNNTQYNQLYAGLQEAKTLSLHAKNHVLRFGSESEFYNKYFGNSSTAEVIGWFDGIVDGEKHGLLFRCDNPDGNCANDGWAGHWRGENGTDETVICDMSYTTRLYLSQMCSRGYTVANSPNTLFWASDLLHRIWHTLVGQEAVGHYADSYEECLELAESSPQDAVRNSNSLRFFALDVYAYDVAVPGVGCTGEPDTADSSSAGTSSSADPTSTTVPSHSSSETSETEHCHTHADGEVHCS